MASLRRIILIQTHLPGVVELSLNGHTNICGTNASGKTTLQRLVPVFYGELPSKVVPRTRKKFDEFYLPKNNSYLIYEYQREEGDICQVVLTSSAKEGVQYRFVDAPYAAEQLLFQEPSGKVNALQPEQWLAKLKQLGIDKSHKISATSEYRSIIQNDASAVRANSKDTTKLRQLAARYSLPGARHKIRHIEKLVSAVHAKEGKMDTLRTMLAAIFEEDGLVQPTTRVKNTKAREWIKQMRQSMRFAITACSVTEPRRAMCYSIASRAPSPATTPWLARSIRVTSWRTPARPPRMTRCATTVSSATAVRPAT